MYINKQIELTENDIAELINAWFKKSNTSSNKNNKDRWRRGIGKSIKDNLVKEGRWHNRKRGKPVPKNLTPKKFKETKLEPEIISPSKLILKKTLEEKTKLEESNDWF